jgi:hypothetical protein
LGPQEQFKFTAPSAGVVVPGFGTQVGPYTGQLSSYPGSPSITLYCVDYLHDINPNQIWTANVSRLNVGDVSHTRLGIAGDDAGALSRYKKAAWLASHFMSNQDVTSWRQIHAAIWTVALDGNLPGKPYFGQYGNWLAAANLAEANGYQGFNFAEWAVVTDIAADDQGFNYDPLKQPGVQEYLVRMTVTPEPETVVLLLSGLLLLGLVWRRGILG